MSYILEALRRAEAERQRGQVPGLHAPAADWGRASSDHPTRRRGLAWAAAGLVAALALGAAWWLGRSHPVAEAASATAAAASVRAASAATAPQPVAVAPPVSPPLPAPALAPAPAPAPAPLPVPPAPSAAVAITTPAVPPSTTPRPAATLRPTPLPPLPPLLLGGGMYSDQPSQRVVIVDGQVLREGDELQPGLRLVQIRPRSAVFERDGQRFERQQP